MFRFTLVFLALCTVASTASTPVTFEANRGQAAADVRYLARLGGYTVVFTQDAAIFRLGHSTVSMTLAGGNKLKKHAEGLGELAGISNYFVGADPAKWHTRIPNFERVRLGSDGPGDGPALVFYGQESQLEYDLVLPPGIPASSVRIAFRGARRLRLDPSGDLILETADGELRQRLPVVYQRIDGADRPVAAHYQLLARNQVGFGVGAYDASAPLVIDPGLTYSTYLGGSADDIIAGVATDSSGNVYATGYTSSLNFPIKGGYQPAPSNKAANMTFITKINPALSGSAGLVYSTYFSGSTYLTQASAIAVDSAGDAYIAGGTDAPDLPTTNTRIQSYFGGTCGGEPCFDAFVAKFDPTGSNLLYGTYLGGSLGNGASAIAVDSSSKIYLVGETNSFDFPISDGAFQTDQSTQAGSAFICKIDPSVSGVGALLYSTYFGGHGGTYYGESPSGLAVDAAGNMYVGGIAFSSNFPSTFAAYQPKLPSGANECGFVAKFLPGSQGVSSLAYSTLVCGPGSTETYVGAVALDSAGNILATGATNTSSFVTTPGSLQPTTTSGIASFVVKVSPRNGGASDLLYSTFLGGSGGSAGTAIALDSQGMVYVAGATYSALNFTDTTYLPKTASSDAVYLAKLNLSLAGSGALLYLGGFGASAGVSPGPMALDSTGQVWIGGNTTAPDFPTLPTAVQPKYAGTSQFGYLGDGFLFRYQVSASTAPNITAVSNSASGQNGVAAGTYLSIYGSNFAPAGFLDTWSNSIVNGILPTQLDGVSVTIGGMPASIVALTPGQINVFAPNLGTGSMQVVVTTAAGVSAPFTVASQTVQPAFFEWPGSYAVATHLDYSDAVKSGDLGVGVVTIPAQPGEYVILWGTGFGPTSPAAPGGQVVPAAGGYSLIGVTVTVGQVNAPIVGAALAPGLAGVYQIAIQVPTSLANGDYPVVASVNGSSTLSSVLLTVQK